MKVWRLFADDYESVMKSAYFLIDRNVMTVPPDLVSGGTVINVLPSVARG